MRLPALLAASSPTSCGESGAQLAPAGIGVVTPNNGDRFLARLAR